MARAIQFKTFALSLLLLALLVSPCAAQAVVLDWDTVTWAGGMSQAFNIDSSNSNNGSTNDIFISITGSTNRFASAPTVNNTLTGGLSPVEKGLFLNMNYTNLTESVTVTVGLNYSGGVSNLSFSLFDVDRQFGFGSDSDYTDKISSIIGRDTNGNVVLPTITTNTGGNVGVGSGSTQYVRGVASINDTSSVGTVTFTFNTAITNFSFTYGNETNAPANPGNQWITLYDISFTPKPKVPEWHPGLIAALLCFGLIGVRRFFF